MLHRVLADAAKLLDAERIGADDAQLLEIDRRPLEAFRCFDADDRQNPARADDAHTDFDRLRRADRVVHGVDAAVEHRQAVPARTPRARTGELRDTGDDLAAFALG